MTSMHLMKDLSHCPQVLRILRIYQDPIYICKIILMSMWNERLERSLGLVKLMLVPFPVKGAIHYNAKPLAQAVVPVQRIYSV